MLHLTRFRALPLALALATSLSACQQDGRPTPAPLPQDPLIQVYTNHNPTSSYTEPYRQQTRSGDNLEQVIIDTIAQAQVSVDVAVQEFRLPRLAQALIERQQAGVRVRVILENTYSRPFSSFTPAEVRALADRERSRYEEFRLLVDQNQDGQLSPPEIAQADALVLLDRAKIPRIDDTADGSAGSNLMHNKFVIVDQRYVIVTSANFTTSDIHGDFATPNSRGNANNLVKLDSPPLAALFQREFSILWGDGAGGKPDSRFGVKKPFLPAQQVMVGPTPVAVQFSPNGRKTPWEESSNGLIGRTLSRATRSLQMALFVFSDQQLVNAIGPLAQRGLEIQALIEPGFAFRPYSEALDMLGIALGDTCQAEASNRPWQAPITTVGVPRLPPGDLLHHKFGIVDGETVITGSHNWTEAANRGNDETVLVIQGNVTVAAHFEQEFGRLYPTAILGIPPAIQKQAAAYAKRCPVPSITTLPSQRQDFKPGLAAAGTPGRKNPRPPAVALPQARQRINLNTATVTELETLPGVGPRLAQRIIAARQQKPFTSLQDLDRVPGVGPKLLQRLKPQVGW